MDASNNGKVKLGSSTKTYNYGATASGADWGSDGSTNKYYSGYAYKSATSSTVPANSNLVVYRRFHAWTDLNIYYAGGTTQGGATVALSTNNSNYTDVTNESNTVQPYGTTYYIKNIRPKNSYESLDRVVNLTYNNAGYYYYTPTTGGTAMSIYMKYTAYSISYNLNGGSVSGNPTSYTYATAAFTLKNPTRSGYTFTGWTGTGLSSASTPVTVPTHSTGNRSYTANWKQDCTFTSKEFNYTGGVQSWQVPTGCGGTYKLEVYGAEGGNALTGSDRYTSTTGKGGYATGTVSLSAGTTLYVVVGGKGATANENNFSAGGYNGGGQGSWYNGGGGGATHIGKSNAVLKSTTSGNLYIVAGGGGGAGSSHMSTNDNPGGHGGGTSGGNAVQSGSATYGYGGSQSAGGTSSWNFNGAYGQGGDVTDRWGGGGGGGGYYGGAGTGNVNGGVGGAGGSGYTGGVSSGSMSNGQRSGNGYAKITKQ